MANEELINRIAANLQYCLEKRGMSQEKLREEIKEKRGYEISQPYMSRIMHGNFNQIPAMPLVTICEALDVDIQKVFWENLDENKILELENKEKESKLVFASKKDEFEKYLGKYHCYFYPTISDETREEILYGILEFYLDKQTKECVAEFVLFTKEDYGAKKYTGRLILSTSYNCCYCYLVNQAFGEVSFLTFEGFSSNSRALSCRMAAVLTPSAGGTRDATCHRMFMSAKKLSQKGISVVAPHLKMNTAEIFITESNLKEFFEEMNVPDKFQHAISCLTEPEMYYALREEHFFGFGTKNMPGYNKNLFVTKLRDKSVAANYHKIGKKVDDILYKYMYKSKDKEQFFVE